MTAPISPDLLDTALVRELVAAGHRALDSSDRLVAAVDRNFPRLPERIGTPIVSALSVMTVVAVVALVVLLWGPLGVSAVAL